MSVNEEMDGILREFEKLEKKQINKPLISSVDHITRLLEEAKRKIQNGTNPRSPAQADADNRLGEYILTYGVVEGKVLVRDIQDTRVSEGLA